MSATTVPAVRAALVAALRAAVVASGDEDTVVTYGHPGQTIPDRFVAVADTDSGVRREQRTLPLRKNSSRTEEYDLRVLIWAKTSNPEPEDQQLMVEAAAALADLVDNTLRDEPTLGGLVDYALPSAFQDEDLLLNEGRAASLTVLVSVRVNRS